VDTALASLLLELTDLSDEEAEQLVFDKYAELYLDSGTLPRRIGIRKTHDGLDCLFTESRFDHAFYFGGWLKKSIFSKVRGVRVAWIGPVIAGLIEKTECWLIPPKDRFRGGQTMLWNRLYLLRQESYVVWLEPGKSNKWWFSSAYVAGRGDLRRYCNAGSLIWVQKNISRD